MSATRDPFVLYPFSDSACPPISLRGVASRSGTRLALRYVLTGHVTAIACPVADPQPDRRHNLWQTTCFECFLMQTHGSHYWELNVSPSGCWNAYQFTDYRQGMEEEKAIAILPVRVGQTAERLQIDVEVNLSALLTAETPVRVAIAAVIQHTSGQLSYWALQHPKPSPDFHARGGFVMEL